MAALKKPKTIMDKLCEGAGIPEGNTAKAMRLIQVLMYGIPKHQAIVRAYLKREEICNTRNR